MSMACGTMYKSLIIFLDNSFILFSVLIFSVLVTFTSLIPINKKLVHIIFLGHKFYFEGCTFAIYLKLNVVSLKHKI